MYKVYQHSFYIHFKFMCENCTHQKRVKAVEVCLNGLRTVLGLKRKDRMPVDLQAGGVEDLRRALTSLSGSRDTQPLEVGCMGFIDTTMQQLCFTGHRKK